MNKKFWMRIAYLGGHLLGKIGYNLMCFGLKRGGFKSIITKMINNYYT